MSVVDESRNGLEKVVIKEPKGSSAEIFLHGAHLTSWKSSSGQEQIFVSDLAVFQPPKAIRYSTWFFVNTLCSLERS